MTEILRVGQVDDVSALIATCQFPEDTLILLEKLPQEVVTQAEERQRLLYFGQFDRKIDLVYYASGRIFHRDFEFRWERSDQKTRVIYLGKKSARASMPILPVLEVEEDIQPDQYTQQEKRYYLFGKRLSDKQLQRIGLPAAEGDFAEVRIPRLLRYPAPGKAQRVRLLVREYVHKETGQLVLFRFERLLSAE